MGVSDAISAAIRCKLIAPPQERTIIAADFCTDGLRRLSNVRIERESSAQRALTIAYLPQRAKSCEIFGFASMESRDKVQPQGGPAETIRLAPDSNPFSLTKPKFSDISHWD
ncbi:MAG TPA: hypothetical protein DCY36_01605 [Acidimicrobiaceae bacterium]|nr:hypothetical protein [Acidimicrobiaceae bacterium]